MTSKLPDPSLPVLEADQPREKKLQTFKVRTIFTVAMLSGFIFINSMGHFYCSLLVLGLTIGMFREILRIKRRVDKDTRLPFFYFLRWYIFSLAFGIGFARWMANYFDWVAAAAQHPEDSWKHSACLVLAKLPNYLPLISYVIAISALIMFTLSLRQFSLRYQFHQLGWVVLTCLMICAQTLGQIALIYTGLYWFFLSNTLVIVNDIFAYLFGVMFGKTRLIALSPKKTVEGFVGASFSTIIWGFVFTYFFSDVPQLACPEVTFHMTPFQFMHDLSSCSPRPYLIAQEYFLPSALSAVTGLNSFWIKPIYFHLAVLSIFAGVIAPFGGFFASGFKRAFKIKDFGDSIPGHGGFTDRFDCMLIMGSFTFVYLTTFVTTGLTPPLSENAISLGNKLLWPSGQVIDVTTGVETAKGSLLLNDVIKSLDLLSVEEKRTLMAALKNQELAEI